jgi:hypothetical protein
LWSREQSAGATLFAALFKSHPIVIIDTDCRRARLPLLRFPFPFRADF